MDQDNLRQYFILFSHFTPREFIMSTMHNVLRVRAMIQLPLVFVILTEGVLDVVTDFFPVSILHSSFSFLKQKS